MSAYRVHRGCWGTIQDQVMLMRLPYRETSPMWLIGMQDCLSWMSVYRVHPGYWGIIQESSYANDIAVSGNTVYVADGKAGLLILNVTNPSMPHLLGHYPAGSADGAWDVTLSGEHYLYGGCIVWSVNLECQYPQ